MSTPAGRAHEHAVVLPEAAGDLVLAGLAGSASDIKIHAERLLHTKRRMAELTSQHTGQSVEQVTRDSDRDRWFDAFEAKEYGLIDDVIPTAAGMPGGGGTGAA